MNYDYEVAVVGKNYIEVSVVKNYHNEVAVAVKNYHTAGAVVKTTVMKALLS